MTPARPAYRTRFSGLDGPVLLLLELRRQPPDEPGDRVAPHHLRGAQDREPGALAHLVLLPLVADFGDPHGVDLHETGAAVFGVREPPDRLVGERPVDGPLPHPLPLGR